MEKTARAIATKLRHHGHIAYFAGGCVRDMVRGLPPKDIDIATDARPEQVQKIFARTYAVGAHFGVIVVLENGLQFEIATFRSDDVYLDGRRPSEGSFFFAGRRRAPPRFHRQRNVFRSREKMN
jgi:poly(A) polymerase